MDIEYALLSRLLEEGGVNGHELRVHRCGMGKVNAAVSAVEIIASERPDLVISTGVAGATSPSVHTGDFVVGATVAYHDAWYGEGNAYGQVQGLPAVFEAPAPVVGKAASLGAIPGLIVSGDRFIETREEVRTILEHFPEALAVDMESGALAQTCFLKGVPFVSLRLISDGDDDAHMESYKNFWQTAGAESFRMVKAFIESL